MQWPQPGGRKTESASRARGPCSRGTEPGLAPDGLQRPLVPRVRFRPQVKPRVWHAFHRSGKEVRQQQRSWAKYCLRFLNMVPGVRPSYTGEQPMRAGIVRLALGVMLLALSVPAAAQQSGKVYRI